MSFAKRVQRVQASATLAMNAKAKVLAAEGHHIINLGVGEPDFATPTHICEAAIQAIHAGQTHYTAEDGTPELKKAIIAKFQRDQGLRYEPAEVVASTGAKQCLYNLIQVLVDQDDEVIIPAPYWVSYTDMVKLADGTPVVLPPHLEHQFKITPEQLEAAITPKTKLFILNSPSNPTGFMYTAAELKAFAQVLLAHPHVYILSDDIYEKIIWTTEPFHNILMVCPELKSRTFVVNGVSKAYAMTGWRLGYMAGPKNVLNEVRKIQSHSTSNPCSITQAAAVAALNGDETLVAEMVHTYKTRHDYFVPALNQIPGFEAHPASGAFYCFPQVTALMQRLGLADDVALAEYLLTKSHIVTIPGSGFGCPGFLRFSYATTLENLKIVIERLSKLV